MEITQAIAPTRALLDRVRADGRTVGLVPTMGFLHAGHASLMERAAAECDVVLATLFVNPLQFGPTEDLDAYPRDPEGDARLAEANGVDVLFAPPVEEMYPEPAQTSISVADLGIRLEGASRPTHFAGVATVVAKLFNIAGPCRAYFGEKDWQQVAVVRRMAFDLSFPVEVVACPTVREADGLARSSRNAYLTADERTAAPVLHRALVAGAELVRTGVRDRAEVEGTVEAMIRAEPLAELDHVAVVDAATLVPVDPLQGELRLLAAARFGRARLIDNVGVVAD
jgi:pantoate--beta-alanine ligase